MERQWIDRFHLKGDEPYVFVCYSHADQDVVYAEIDWLNRQGVNVWFDEGISAGKVWRAFELRGGTEHPYLQPASIWGIWIVHLPG